MSDARRRIPSVERVLASPAAAPLLADSPRALVADAVAAVQQRVRTALGRGTPTAAEVERIEWYAEQAAVELATVRASSLRRTVNATGVILHTNLGRAPLARSALAAVVDAARGYSNLEYELADGARGSRYAHCVGLLRRLTGAPDALVVNNNAAALVLALNTLAHGRPVLLSRGELVEIGGSFRIPDILARSGARLREVGTTNRTHLADYEAALDSSCAAILKVHPSNYRIVGFAAEAETGELAALAATAGIPLIHDLGSGLLLESAELGLPATEPTVPAVVAAGAAVVSFSGDKLLGGPQAGILAGEANLLARMRANPLCRALRVDKLTLAALEATLRHYLDPAEAMREVPVLRMIAEPLRAVRARAERLAARLRAAGIACSVVESSALIGGGAFPGEELPSRAVALDGVAEGIAARLRAGEVPVIARLLHGRVLLDTRTLSEDDVEDAVRTVTAALAGHEGA